MMLYTITSYTAHQDSLSIVSCEAGRTRQMSVLFTHSTAVKFINALNKLPL